MNKMNTEIVEHKAEVLAPADPMVSMIERLVMDEDVDLARIEKMMDLKERQEAKTAEAAYNAALAACQSELPAIVARANNNQTRSKYATLADIYAVAKPVTGRHGFSFSTWPTQAEKEGHLGVKWILRHSGGHSETGVAEIPVDDVGMKGTKNKTPTHAFGSSNSYARRYLFCMVFDIAIEKEDDDGNSGGGKPVATVSEEQYIQVRDFAGRLEVDEAVICKAEKINDLHELPAHRFDGVMRKLETTEKQRAEAAEKESLSVDLEGEAA